MGSGVSGDLGLGVWSGTWASGSGVSGDVGLGVWCVGGREPRGLVCRGRGPRGLVGDTGLGVLASSDGTRTVCHHDPFLGHPV